MKSSLRSLPLVVLTALLFGPVSSLLAQTIGGAPNTIDYQGKALDAQGAVLAPSTAANYEMTFRIYDAQEGGTIIWAEKQIVTVFKGLFSVRLGEGTTIGEGTVLQTNLADAFNAASRFLGVTIDDGTAAVKVIDNGLHLRDGDGLEAREDDQQVSVLQCFGAGDVAGVPQRDVAGLRVDAEQHRAGEALVLGEDARELRQGLLGLVLMVVGDEHDLLAFAGAFGADVRQRGIGRAGDEAEQSEGEDGEGAHGRD